jgi:hypothetical protein
MTHESSAADGSQKPRAIVLAVAVPARASVAPDSVCALPTRTTLPKSVRLRRMSCLQTLHDVLLFFVQVLCVGVGGVQEHISAPSPSRSVASFSTHKRRMSNDHKLSFSTWQGYASTWKWFQVRGCF